MFSILYVDDEPGLLEIGKLFLEQGGRFSVETLTSAGEALEILKTRHYDAIISDYQMPVMNGIDFLKRVRASGSTLPFIIFTGRGREEIVIQAFNEGADFYLQKGGEPLSQFAELGHKIQKAILQRKAETSIRDHERREADIINFLPDATFAIDTRGVVIAWNRAMEKMTGVPAEQVLGKDNYEYAIPFYHERRPILIDLALSADPAIDDRYPYVKRDGKTLISEITIPHFHEGRGAALWFTTSLLYDTGGTVVGAIESIREITEWKRTEDALNESEQKYRTVFETTGTATILIENDATMSLVNSEFARLSGYPKDEIENRKKWTEFVVQEDLDRMLSQHNLRRQNRQDALTHYEFRFLTRSGDVRDIYLTIDVIPGTEKSVASLLDITERKKVESSLVAAGREYANLLDQIQDIYYRSDAEGRLIRGSRSLAALLGYDDLSECIGRSIADDFYVNPTDRKLFLEAITREGRVTDFEVFLKKKDGTAVLVSTSSHMNVDENGRMLGVEGTFRNITGRKQQEHILRTQRDLGLALQTTHGMRETLDFCLDAAIKISGLDCGGIYLVDEGSGALDLAVTKNLGTDFVREVSHYPAGSANGQIVMAGKPIYTRFSMTGLTHNALQKQEGLRASAIIPIAFKNRITACLNIASHTLDEIPANAQIALETIATQIGTAVEQIHAIKALAESEQRYRNIVEDQTEFICRFRPDGTHVFVNDAYCRYFSLKREEIVGHRFRPKMPPEHQETIKRFFASLTPDHPVDTIEHEIIMPDGRICWQRWSDRAIFDPAGTITEYQSVGRDITHQKKTEDALRQKTEDLDSRNRLISTMLDTVPIAIFMVEAPSGKPIIANREATRLLGRGILPNATGENLAEVYEAYKTSTSRRYPAEEMPVIRGMYGESRHIDDMVVVRPDGTMVQLEIFGTPVIDGQGRVAASLVSFLDITERKRAEQVIREANRKINLLTSITRHDVANQVSIIRGFTNIALMKKPDPGIASLLEKIDAAVSAIARQIEFTRAYQELGMHAPDWQRIRDIVIQHKAEGITLSCTCDAEVYADPMLERVFFNLVDNAARHGEKITAITVSCRPDPDGLVIVVGDDGIGVPNTLKEKIFEKGYGKHTGFGLFLAREILAITGIIILETGTPGKGAQFEIIVPKGMYRFMP
jgi:PAS domain S-box-containing protein